MFFFVLFHSGILLLYYHDWYFLFLLILLLVVYILNHCFFTILVVVFFPLLFLLVECKCLIFARFRRAVLVSISLLSVVARLENLSRITHAHTSRSHTLKKMKSCSFLRSKYDLVVNLHALIQIHSKLLSHSQFHFYKPTRAHSSLPRIYFALFLRSMLFDSKLTYYKELRGEGHGFLGKNMGFLSVKKNAFNQKLFSMQLKCKLLDLFLCYN